MGDIADMIMDGLLCEGCGVYLEDANGFPQRCSPCKRIYEQETKRKNNRPKAPKSECPVCHKKFKTGVSLAQHRKDTKHLDSGKEVTMANT